MEEQQNTGYDSTKRQGSNTANEFGYSGAS